MVISMSSLFTYFKFSNDFLINKNFINKIEIEIFKCLQPFSPKDFFFSYENLFLSISIINTATMAVIIHFWQLCEIFHRPNSF